MQRDDFVSTDTAGVTGPRQKDGSLPDVEFLHLAPSSNLVDVGTDVGLPFAGSAPDLGAFEVGMSTALEDTALPAVALAPNYPNPFRRSTRLTFEVAEAGVVRLVIFNAPGQRVATLVDNMLPASQHTVDWTVAGHLPSGVYFTRLETDPTHIISRMTLTK